jgi:hypothetical protein
VAEVALIGNEPAIDEFQVKVGEAGKDLAERLTTAETLLRTEYANALASDYGRLKTAGSCASAIASDWANCPHDHADWQLTQDDQRNAAHRLQEGAQATAYGTLLAARYRAWTLPPNPHTTANDAFAGLVYFRCWYPFAGSPASAQLANPIDATGNGISSYEITALGYETGSGLLTDRWQMHTPEAGVTNPLFGTGSGDLGVDKEQFFDTYFPYSARARDWHYPERDTRTGWLPDCAPSAAGSGKSGAKPRSLTLTAAVRRGITVLFTVPKGHRASVNVVWYLGTRRIRRPAVPRSVRLLHRRLVNFAAGSYSVGARLSRAEAQRVRGSGRHRVTIRIRVHAGHRTTTSFQTLWLRYGRQGR